MQLTPDWSFVRLSRCPCCVSKHAKRTKLNSGKSSARNRAKRALQQTVHSAGAND